MVLVFFKWKFGIFNRKPRQYTKKINKQGNGTKCARKYLSRQILVTHIKIHLSVTAR